MFAREPFSLWTDQPIGFAVPVDQLDRLEIADTLEGLNLHRFGRTKPTP
jgi:hypothetical protein